MKELDVKLDRIQRLLEEHKLDALALRRVSSFAWATCGGLSYVNTAASEGIATLLITPHGRHLITNNIEAPRLEKEENLKAEGWEFHVAPWYATDDTFASLTHGLRLAADGPMPGAVDLSAELARLRSNLLPEEVERFRKVCEFCATSMDRAIRAVRPGMTEYQIGVLLASETDRLGVQTIVNLIATDERIFNYRHPLPTGKKLERYAMLVLCGRRWGLVCSLTRLVYFGKLSDEINHKAQAVAEVDAAMILATRPGKTLGDVFQVAMDAYERAGFADEWQLHHQGGPAAYEPREYVATPDSKDIVIAGQVYAWNPSITGAKSEDTILVGENENKVMTDIVGWPMLEAKVGNQVLPRPGVLEIR